MPLALFLADQISSKATYQKGSRYSRGGENLIETGPVLRVGFQGMRLASGVHQRQPTTSSRNATTA